MKKSAILILTLFLVGYLSPPGLSQIINQQIKTGKMQLAKIEPELQSFTEADHTIRGLIYNKAKNGESLIIFVDNGITLKNLTISSNDLLWLSYKYLINFPSGTPIRFYLHQIPLSEINEKVPLSDYLIPVVINKRAE